MAGAPRRDGARRACALRRRARRRAIFLKVRHIKAGFISPIPILGCLLLMGSALLGKILKLNHAPRKAALLLVALVLFDLLALALAKSLHTWSQRDQDP